MFWFGENKDQDFDWQDEKNWQELSSRRPALVRTGLDSILDLLDSFSKESFDEALPELMRESGFSNEETKKTLGLLPGLLRRENLEKRIKAEFNRSEVLDRFVKIPHGDFKVRAVPRGILLHVTAGNVFLSAIDSLIMGFVTKNLSILKVSSQNRFFPLYFARKLKSFDKKNILADKFAILHWKGGDEKIEHFLKRKVDTIIAWGGEEMVASYSENLPSRVKLLDFGPRISIQVISKNGMENKSLEVIAEKIVADISPWDQSACASPQNLYIETGIDEQTLVAEIEKAFLKLSPPGLMSEDEATEILKEKYRGYYSELMDGGRLSVGINHLIHLESSQHLRPSPLHRSLIIKRFNSSTELRSLLEPFSTYLQSCSYLLSDSEKEGFLEDLCLSGLKRFAPLGTITWGLEGAPHDGRFVLRELVTFISDEIRMQNYGEKMQETHGGADLKSYFDQSVHPRGYIFSSGGTSGEPKFLHFSYEEFDYMSDMLAYNLKQQGIRPGMTVANLFVAGNLWSSFLCIEKALEKIGAIQLPIGGMCSEENIHLYLMKFRPQVVMGIPSMLIKNAEFMENQSEKVTIPMVFYAGEALSKNRQEYLSRIWGSHYFGSAGYASVDAGVIGYQCLDCEAGEHHVFTDLVDLQIVEEEAIVTSLARNSMPIKHYRTGDRVEWREDCRCGSKDKKFKLLGRTDNVIQIWSCRLLSSEVELTLSQHGIMTFQIRITEIREANVVREKMTIAFEKPSAPIDREVLLQDLYNRSRDVRDTISFTDFKKDIQLEALNGESIIRNPRTGKISLVIDQRR